MQIRIGCSRSSRLGNRCTCASNRGRVPYRLGHVPRWHPGFVDLFKILERIRSVAYRLALPPTIKFHDVFHVSLLKKYVKDVDHVIDWFVLQVDPEGEFLSEPQCKL